MLQRVGLIVLFVCVMASPVMAQNEFLNVSDTLSSNGDSFIAVVRGMASLRLQTLDSYSGTWEVQCSADGGVTYDTDDELNLSLEGASNAPVQAVTDAVGIWTANVAGCTHVKIIATAGFAASDTTVAVSAITAGGGSAASGSSSVTGGLANDADAAATNRIATLPVITEASAPSRTDGRNAALSGTAGGAIRVMVTNAAGAATTIATDVTEDQAETAGGTGPFVQSVRRDAAASSAGTTGDNASFNTDALGMLWTRVLDPCSGVAKTTTAISLTADTVIISATASKKNYICSIVLMAGSAEVVGISEGTGSTCATNEAALVGSTTDANSMPFAANGGFSAVGGNASVIVGISTNVDTCLNVSAGSVRVAGWVTWVQAP